jgi:TM2 domain-containing membrane protein YozV
MNSSGRAPSAPDAPNGAAIERRLLDLAYTTDAKITVPALAYFAPCTIAEAAAVLDDLTAHERLTMEVEDDGTIVYQLLGRQKLGTTPAAPAPRALVPISHARREASPLAAAMLSVMVPGAGHLYAGRILAAIMWFVVVTAGYALILPGLIFHLFSIMSAAASAQRLNASSRMMLAA